MRSADGILGTRAGAGRVAADVARRRKWLKRRETWLVILGVILHAVYMLSIFDIYFKTPIVHGMDPVQPRFTAPAKRLVLLVADGLRADKFFEPDVEGNYRAPFLRSVIRNQGRWGVSHARPPTESRPGHVAIIAGFYEDPSAVTKGWKANPVEFDSVFNQSRHTFSYGSPDIVPIFCSALPHSTWKSYPHEFEDFATDASFLDEWSFDQFQSLLNRSNEDPKLKELLLQDKLVIFLHLLGYYYKDNRTAYIFTADHGMSDKGSHGDGHPTNTDTPLVAWGAGVKYPRPVSESTHSDHGLRFVDEHEHDTPTPVEWGLSGIERVDVNQADIAPLMVSTLVGIPCPVNSVGNLPLGYISMIKAEEVEAVLANTKQILSQFLRKSQMKQSSSLYFKPFGPLANHSALLEQIESLISIKDYEAAVKLSEDLRSLALQGLHYFQTYDWLMLMTMITLGYIGWMLYIILHVLQSYTSLARDIMKMQPAVPQKHTSGKVYLLGFLVMGITSLLLIVEHSPPLYHSYIAMTVFLWTNILGEYRFIQLIWRYLSERKSRTVTTLIAVFCVSIVVLELLVHSFTERKLYTWCFLTVGIVAPVYLFNKIPWRSWIPVFVCATCWCLSVFTLMPAEIPDNTELVITSGVLIVIMGAAARWLDFHSEGNKYWMNICFHGKEKLKFPMLFYIQALFVGLSSIMVPLSTSHRTEKQELHTWHQLINWLIAGFSMILPLFSENGLLSRLTSIFLGFAPTFLLLSIGYEALFYGALSLVLMSWIIFENTLLQLTKAKKMSSATNMDANTKLENGDRFLQLSDMRIPLTFMVLFNVAFFGTGNFASIASFEISSVYRFITVFSPFLMAALLIFKLFIPFMLVIFNSGVELASSVVDSELLDQSWSSICNLYTEVNSHPHQQSPSPATFKIFKQHNLTIIAFVTSPIYTPQHLQQQGGQDLLTSATLKAQNFPHLDFLCSRGNPSFSIHSAAVSSFALLFDDLKASPHQFLVSRDDEIVLDSPLIVTGHALGGSIASLFTLWLLDGMSQLPSKKPSKKLPLCITFGSPLIGDSGLHRGISQRSTWKSSFLHVVSNHDFLPRLLIAIHSSSSSSISNYEPFGTFLMCDEQSCDCVGDPEIVSRLLSHKATEQLGSLDVDEYGKMVEYLKSRVICRGSSILGRPMADSMQAGIALQLQSIGISLDQVNRDLQAFIFTLANNKCT
ncbi:unnamed protein product [Linum tenue]|uniref:GPI ethanolamine phosphate transferase 1 n=1 Tax=Linum tenue TaxID=586396 RepID=A0AAV0NAW9_9ROSI|nr:unnamed protein product [Linum tenue]